jgi:PKD repeat protein
MTIPIASTYPITIDTNQNLYHVHDSLRVRLIEDYNPGDKSITVFGDETTMRLFNTTGIITLTEQCSDPEYRAISFYYGSRTLTTFDQLELLPGFVDTAKPKNLTDVTQNVMDVHHNSLKNALISIEQFAGRKGEVALRPLEGTMEQRINYLRKLALAPKAWFKVDKNIGLAPLTVEFEDQSFRLGGDGTLHEIEHLWDFGDNSGPSIITIEQDTEVPSNLTNVLVNDISGGKIKKTYTKPGIYSVTLTVKNEFGTDSVTFNDIISARFPAPDYAVVNFIQRTGQIVTSGSPVGGPYTIPPKIRATTNSIIDITIPPGINSFTEKTYSGEVVDGNNTPIDPIQDYTWSLSDDLSHSNSSNARAVFSIGGVYDLTLRVDTKFGAYRITSYQDSFDIVEKVNLWLWTYNNPNSVSSFEFGMISETFKTKNNNILTLGINDSFLTGLPNENQQKKEFIRNNGFAQRGSSGSGVGGVGLLYWASGRDSASSATTEEILMSEYNGFVGTYTSRSPISRPWNWVDFASADSIYFFLGGITGNIPPNTSPTNQTKTQMLLNDFSVSNSTFTNANYKNGANELTNNEVTFDGSGEPEQGHMSVYRSVWHEETGYFLRNEGVGDFFRIKSFYKTSGNSTEPFQDIRKLPDMIGSAKVEGQLLSLSQGVYFFSNSGALAAYNPISGIWATGGPGANSSSFRLLQDSNVVGFDNGNQTFLAASDGDRIAYLSFDYSPKSFIKFNESDTTFSGVTSRPTGTQWQMCIF